jgi:3-oxoacyl-[acyl-carrier-protein] synthase-1
MSLAISGLGVISSVGRSAAQACASIRAGISRPETIDYFHLLDPETQEAVPLAGHPIRGYTEGFTVTGLWVRLAGGCLSDLMKHGGVPDRTDTGFWQKTGLIAVAPYIQGDRFLGDGSETPELIKQAYLYPLHEYLGLPIPISRLHVVCMGQTGTIAAMALAESLTMDRDIERVILLAVDSYLDSLTLEWLAKYGRLKGGENPTGLAPGEAGVCIMLERLDVCRLRGAPIQAVVEGFAVGKEPQHLFSQGVNRGAGLSKVIRQVLARTGPLPFSGNIICDQNGENWRAAEITGALMSLNTLISPDCVLILPATSIGDVGSASGAISVCVGVRSFLRGYAQSGCCLITTSSEQGDVGAACLKAA